MTFREIQLYDNQNMYDVLKNFPLQIGEAYEIGESLDVPEEFKNVSKIIVSGLGGSAIGGDLLRSYLWYNTRVPIYVNRSYNLPGFADNNTLVIVSSYSGNTEESLASYEDAKKRNCKIICLTSGGDLHTLAANENRFLIQIPKGYQPRCALAYSFFPLLILTSKLGFVADVTSGILKVKNNLVSKSELYCLPDNDRNSAVNLAKHIEGTLPVIYSSSDVLDIVNLRWRCQLNENAKTLAYGNLLPEMNHNEIVGWQHMQELMKKIAVISMIDREDNSRVKRRMEITLSLISNQRGKLIEVEGEGETRLERIFDLIHLGDWVSFYLAILYKEDPTPVEFITFLKNRLTES